MGSFLFLFTRSLFEMLIMFVAPSEFAPAPSLPFPLLNTLVPRFSHLTTSRSISLIIFD
jgi:hypothetical protein